VWGGTGLVVLAVVVALLAVGALVLARRRS
jgi:MprA protease rhombosortase-interaction domain-containing protein